jgi:hypothetical protein
MKTKILISLGIVFLLIATFVFYVVVIIGNEIVEQPTYRFTDVDFDICEYNLHGLEEFDQYQIQSTDTIYKDRSYFFILNPIFTLVSSGNGNSSFLGTTFPGEGITYDSIIKIEVYTVVDNQINQIDSSIKDISIGGIMIYFNEDRVSTGGDINSYISLYNDLNNGRGDYYHSDFETLGYKIELDSINYKGLIKIGTAVSFSDGRKYRKEKLFYLTE